MITCSENGSKYSVAAWTLVMLALVQCSNPPREFAVYEINPLKESVVKNKVLAYVQYGYVDGTYMEGDSVTFDKDGYVTTQKVDFLRMMRFMFLPGLRLIEHTWWLR